MAKIQSPSKSFKGWNIKEWFLGNGKTVKELIKVGLPFITTWLASGGNLAISGFVAIVGKFLIDGIEYWLKQY